MKIPRFRIQGIMLAVAIVALNCGALRATSDYASGQNLMLCTAALPMANVLVIGVVIGHRHSNGRRFLLGFEAFGAAALAYLFVAILSNEDWVWSYMMLAVEPLRLMIRPTNAGEWSTPRILVGRAVVSLWITLPQVALAFVGGCLSYRYRQGCAIAARHPWGPS